MATSPSNKGANVDKPLGTDRRADDQQSMLSQMEDEREERIRSAGECWFERYLMDAQPKWTAPLLDEHWPKTELVAAGECIYAMTRSHLLVLDAETGSLIRTLKPQAGYKFGSFAVGDDALFVSIYEDAMDPGEGPNHVIFNPLKSACETLRYDGDTITFRISDPEYAMSMLRYDGVRGLLIQASGYGLSAIDPRTGRRQFHIHRFPAESQPDNSCVLVPALGGDVIYVINLFGTMWALRWPHPDERSS